jgi:hypothetical protein
VSRAVSTPLAAVLLALLTVATAALVGGGALGIAANAHATTGGNVVVVAGVQADGTITLTNEGGSALDVDELDVEIRVGGERLATQPPVPFFAARGFGSGPSGPFNPADDQTWAVGESASVRVADTNDPAVSPGDAVTVRIYRSGSPVATAEATARSG